MELCTLKEQACPSNKKLGDDEVRAMIKFTAIPPKDRKKGTEGKLSALNQESKSDDYAQAFGIRVDDKMLKCMGRVLEPPTLGYKISKYKYTFISILFLVLLLSQGHPGVLLVPGKDLNDFYQ